MQNRWLLITLGILYTLSCFAMEERNPNKTSKDLERFISLLEKHKSDKNKCFSRNNLIDYYYNLTEQEQQEAEKATKKLGLSLENILNLEEEEIEFDEQEDAILDEKNEIEEKKQQDTEKMNIDAEAAVSEDENEEFPILTSKADLDKITNTKEGAMDITSDEAATILEETVGSANVYLSENEKLSKLVEQALQEQKNVLEKNKQLNSENNELKLKIFQLKREMEDLKSKLSNNKTNIQQARASQLMITMNQKRNLEIQELKKIKQDLLNQSIK